MYQNNQNKSVNRFLIISSIIIILILGVIIFLIIKISPAKENTTLQSQTEKILTEVNNNNLALQLNDGKISPLHTSDEVVDKIINAPLNTNSPDPNINNNAVEPDQKNQNFISNDKIVVSADETVSKINSFIKTSLVSGEEVLIIPRNYADYAETVDYVPIQNSIDKPLLYIDDLKYSQSYLKDYVLIKNTQGIKFTSKNVAFLDSFRYKNKVYWLTLVQGIGGVGRLILSEPNFVNQSVIPDFKDDLIISVSKNNTSTTGFTVEITNGNGLKVSNMRYDIDLSKVIDGRDSALTK